MHYCPPDFLFFQIFEGDQKLFQREFWNNWKMMKRSGFKFLRTKILAPSLKYEINFFFFFFFGYETEESQQLLKMKKKPGRGKGPPLKPHTHPNPPPCCLLYAAQGSSFLYFSRRKKKKWLWSFAIKTSFLFFSGSRRLEPFSYLHEEGGGGRNTQLTHFFFFWLPLPNERKIYFFFSWCVSWVVFFFICCARFAPNVRYLHSFLSLSVEFLFFHFTFFHHIVRWISVLIYFFHHQHVEMLRQGTFHQLWEE